MTGTSRTFVLGISGASGASYAMRLLDLLLADGYKVHLVATDFGRRLLADELNISRADFDGFLPHLPLVQTSSLLDQIRTNLICHPHKDVGAVIASGSFLHDGMVVLPLSSQSLGAIASGAGSNLLVRAAHVTLKERRPLILCHREMPLNLIDIENMRTLALAGAIMCSPNPGFYLKPQRIEDIIDFVVGKVLDLLKVPHTLAIRWQG
ncbi:MAG: UbiX family flavin prenyltransferase [Phycisphaeraceae bacterium]|nr:UbiX family flavin prenyltransferase [Phycisphaerales bacterium]MCB9860127.1 UbiX family flavin prenyltransferase [Phycisphaeraceae bacterium]